MTDATDLLLDLKDIHEPLAPATSSALLLSLLGLCAGLATISLLGYYFWQRKTLNRSLQNELKQISQQHPQSSVQQIAVLLRRIMHHIHGDSINQLQDEPWLHSLDSTFATDYFSHGPGTIFGESLYQARNPTQTTDIDTQQLCTDLHKLIGRVRLRPRK